MNLKSAILNTSIRSNLSRAIAVSAVAVSMTVITIADFSGCRSRQQPASTTSRLSADSTGQTISGPLTTRIRLMHTDSTAVDSAHPIRPTDTVHALIHTEYATDTSSLDGTWIFATKRAVIAENKATLAAGTNDTHFDLMNAHPWPLGDYELIVNVDNKARDTARLTIAKH